MNFIKLKNRSTIALQSLFCAATLFTANCTFASEKIPTTNDFFTAPLRKIEKRVPYKDCIDFLEDANGKEFVLKYHYEDQKALNEALGTHIGESMGIPINRLKIFPAHDPSLSSVDRFPNQIKTLHTLAPGKEVAYTPDLNVYIYITEGLKYKENLESLTRHKDLCEIMALDIFLGNWDRHNGNLFYDKKSNHFYAIDMDATFSHSNPWLATNAYKFVKNLNIKRLSLQEKDALIHVKKALHNLISQYPPEKVCLLKKDLAEEAHYAYNQWEQEDFRDRVEYNFRELSTLQNQLDYVRRPSMLQLMAKKLKGPINQKNMLQFNLQKQPTFLNNIKLPKKQTVSTVIDYRHNLSHE